MDLRIAEEIASLYRQIKAPQLVVEARFSKSGALECASPLSGQSLYWPAAIASIESKRLANVYGRYVIFVFEDPALETVRRARVLGKSAQPCEQSLDLQTLLHLGAGNISWNRPQDAKVCFDLALKSAPDSLAANYGAAFAAGQLGDTESRIQRYEKVISLSPQYYEARFGLAAAQRFAGRLESAEGTLAGILADSPPLPIKKRAYDDLASIYDQTHRRRECIAAARSGYIVEQEIRKRDISLISPALIAFDALGLAAREEEIGDYREAVDHFTDAVRQSTSPGISGAIRYEADLGRIRSVRRLGKYEEAAKGCADWQQRLATKQNEFEDQHWGGRAVVLAKWQFSCGNFTAGVDLLLADCRRRPASDTPYLALERAYRASGQSNVADQLHLLADKIRTEHDQAILDAIVKEAQDLARTGSVQRLE